MRRACAVRELATYPDQATVLTTKEPSLCRAVLGGGKAQAVPEKCASKVVRRVRAAQILPFVLSVFLRVRFFWAFVQPSARHSKCRIEAQSIAHALRDTHHGQTCC